MVSLLSLLVSAHSALAQTSHYWKITYSTILPVPPGTLTGVWSYNSSTSNQNVNGTWDNTDFYTINGSDKRSNSISGIVTATLTWIPTTGQTLQSDPPPSPVSVLEFANAIESSSLGSDPNTHGPAGSVSDGFTGDTPVALGTGYVSSGYHVTSATPNAAGVITISDPLSAVNPTYSMTNGYPPYTRWPSGANYVGFTVYPVTIGVGGTTCTSSGLQLLTGQQVSSSLSVDPTFTIDNATYQWNAGGDTFETYDTSAPTTAHPTQLVPLSAADLAAASFNFYDKSAETITVTCNATVVCPDGTRLAVTGQSPPIAVKKPTVTAWGINTGTGVQQGIPSGAVQPGMQGTAYTMFANEIWGPITISTPQLGTTTVGGQGCIVQIITNDGDNSTRIPLGAASPTCIDVIKTAGGKYVAVPTPALDTDFPYPFGYTLNAQGVMDTSSNTGSSLWNVTQSGYSGDEPDTSVFPPTYDAGGTNWTQSVFPDTYNTYVMYQPPGGVWVPLQMLTWSYSLTASPSTGGPIINPYNNAHWGVSNSQFSGGTAVNTSTPHLGFIRMCLPCCLVP